MKPRLIILAAGEGKRLRPLTTDRPKCMIEIHGKPILHWQIEAARKAGVEDIVVVRGYLGDTINIPGVTYVENPNYATTNMVETLFCAVDYFKDPLIVSYGDILYEDHVIQRLLNLDNPLSVIVDTEWESYWAKRFLNPMDDAETLKLDPVSGRILEIGQKPEKIEDIQAQYIGLVSFREEGLLAAKKLYDREKNAYKEGKRCICKGRGLPELYMTDLIQGLINEKLSVSPVSVSGGWLEIDNMKDLKLAESFVDRKSSLLSIER